MSLKLILSTHLDEFGEGLYEAISLIVDTWFHVNEGKKDKRIDYCKLALYLRKLVAENIGVKKDAKKDENKMDHTKTLNIKENGLTRFSVHNAMFHLLLDMDHWNNLHLAQCKTLEKTNKNTKDAILKGGIRENLCNRIMQYRSEQLKLVYLLEGNGVDDQGIMDPYNGKNKLDPNSIKSLKDIRWLSVFVDQKLNPTQPQYCDGAITKNKIKEPQFTSPFRNYEFKTKLLEAIWNTDQGAYTFSSGIDFYKELNYWRNMKKYIVGRGSLLVKIGNRNTWKFMLVLSICRLNTDTKYQEIVVIGHEVIRIQPTEKDRNAAARIAPNIICWSVSEIYSNAYYYHLCTKYCKEKNGVIEHDWIGNYQIVIFWNLGMGKLKIDNPLIRKYTQEHFIYPPQLQYGDC